MGKFVIRWDRHGYVTKRSTNRKPYTQDPLDPDTKTWATYEAAQRFLSKKDERFAASCVIVSL